MVKNTFGDVEYYVNSTDQISFRTKDNINITFLWYYFNSFFPLVKTKSIALSSIKDIAADKAHTIGRRAVFRDYVDFFILLKDKLITLDEISALAIKKFGGEFNEVLFLEQLTYFTDIEITPVEFIGESYTKNEIEFFLKNLVKTYTKTLIK